MYKKIFISLMIVTLSGCTTTSPRSYTQGMPVIDRARLIEPPAPKTQYKLVTGNDPSLERAFGKYVKTGRASNIMTSGFVRFAYNGEQQPIVMTNPLQETIISLEPGEHFTNVTTGDPGRWSYSAAVSGTGASQQFNILVKPSLANIATNMVITTDRRVYNLKLVSTDNGTLTRNVRFWYPEEMVAALNQEIVKNSQDQTVSEVPDVSLNTLNFDYSISSNGIFRPSPTWKPIRVFDDGVHTYIEFSPSMANRDMPVLFISSHGNKELVNYRSKKPYFVVDKIFNEAVLVMGVGSDQTKVTITNNRYN